MGAFQGRDIIVQFGLNTAPPSFKARIKKFLEYYLGSDEAPTPFGGREKLLNTLNAWLADPKAPRNMLVSAPAGRGKSALLVRWLQQLGEEWPVCFIPISIRYETNRAAVFYQAMAARLAAILGETLPQTPSDPGVFYQEKVIEYLDQFNQPNRRCLIVIDGLDEAAGWRLDTTVLPARPPEGIRIVVSARQLAGDRGSSDWLRRLGWGGLRGTAQALEVPLLTKGGIAEVLHNMGFPLRELSLDVDVIAELYRLTEGGDPLMLEYYVFDMTKPGSEPARLRPKDLADLKPGFAAYFKDWFEQQRKVSQAENRDFDEQIIKAALALLACAHGPITLDSLSPAMQRLLGSKLLISKESLQPISRFVIGDGVESGLVFAHPRLAIFIQEDYFAHSGAVDDARRAIADWGRTIVDQLNAGLLEPKKTPDYALRYYVQHLEELRDVPPLAYRELVGNGWISAWLARDEGMRGFARDAGVAFTKLRQAAEKDHSILKQPGIGLGGQIRCALCLSSIRSMGSAVPPNFMVELVRQNLLSPRQALHFARMQEQESQARVLEGLAALLGGDLLEEAVADARAIGAPKNQSSALAALAAQSAEPRRTELFQEAGEAAAHCEYDYDRDAALGIIERLKAPQPQEPSPVLRPDPVPPEAIVPDPALRVDGSTVDRPSDDELQAFADCVTQSDYWPVNRTLPRMAPFLPPDLLAACLRMVLDGGDPWFHEDLGSLSPHLNSEQLSLALESTLALTNSYVLKESLGVLSPYLNPEQLSRALELTLALPIFYQQSQSLAVLVPCLSSGQLGLALESALSITDAWELGARLANLSPFLSESARGQAVETISQWKDADRVARALTSLIPDLPGSLHERVLNLLISSSSYWAGEGLGRLLVASGEMFDRIIDLLQSAESYIRTRALETAAPDLQPDVMKKLIDAMSDNMADFNAILPFVPEKDRAAAVTRVYKTAFRIGDSMAVAAALTALSTRLPEKDAKKAMTEACALAKQIPADQERAFACLLVSFSELIPLAERRELFLEARQSASELSPEEINLTLRTAVALSSLITQEELDGWLTALDAQIEDLTDQDMATALRIFAGFASNLPESRRGEILKAAEDKLGNTKNPDLGFALASLLPWLPKPIALSWLERSIPKTQATDSGELFVLISLSPLLTAEEALGYAEKSLAAADPGFEMVIGPYLPESRMQELLGKALAKAPRNMRFELLAAIGAAEGQWLEMLGVHPALGGAMGRRSCLETIGGPQAIPEVYTAIRDVMKWWP